LHVRVSNDAAYNLYNSLGYKVHETDLKYYADGEDA
jgi:ribosomal protein S18 acetylase RimI-like enzyme